MIHSLLFMMGYLWRECIKAFSIIVLGSITLMNLRWSILNSIKSVVLNSLIIVAGRLVLLVGLYLSKEFYMNIHRNAS